MYRLSKKMKNVYTCYTNGHHSLIVVEKKEVLLDNETIFKGQEYTSANFCSDNFFQFGDSQNYFLGNTIDKIVKQVDYTFSNKTLTSKGGVITKNYRYDESDRKIKGDYYYLSFDKNNEKLLLKDSEWNVVLTFNDEKNALVRKLNTLKSLALETSEFLWEVSLSAYGYQDSALGYVDAQIRQVIGISDNVLVVYMQSGTLVGIDTQTGAILWDIPFSWTYYPSDYQGNGWYWHLEDGFLYLLQHRYYLRIDLATQKLEVLWQLSNKSMNIEDCSYDSNYAYFMAIDTSVSMIQPSILGVFDRKALKIVWQYDKPIGSSKPPQSDGSKLYCLDNEGTLHIFDKEHIT